VIAQDLAQLKREISTEGVAATVNVFMLLSSGIVGVVSKPSITNNAANVTVECFC
jgi:hypothetical protein